MEQRRIAYDVLPLYRQLRQALLQGGMHFAPVCQAPVCAGWWGKNTVLLIHSVPDL